MMQTSGSLIPMQHTEGMVRLCRCHLAQQKPATNFVSTFFACLTTDGLRAFAHIGCAYDSGAAGIVRLYVSSRCA